MGKRRVEGVREEGGGLRGDGRGIVGGGGELVSRVSNAHVVSFYYMQLMDRFEYWKEGG